MQKTSAGIEKKDGHTVYTGSLIKSYIQSHLTPRWNPLNNSKQITNPCRSWTLQEQGTHNAEKLYFSSKNTPRNPIKKCLNNHLYTRMNKERKHLKRRCKKLKTTALFCSSAMTEPQPLTKAHNEQAHLNFFKRTFQENIQIFCLSMKTHWSVLKNVITQCPFMWDVPLFVQEIIYNSFSKNSWKLL